MFNGSIYSLVIALLTLMISVVLTMRQIEQTGVHVELIIRPSPANPSPDEVRQSIAGRLAGKRGAERPPGENIAETTIDKRR